MNQVHDSFPLTGFWCLQVNASHVSGAMVGFVVQRHTLFRGVNTVISGAPIAQDTAEECCDLCKKDPRCNVWAWCAAEGGCGGPDHVLSRPTKLPC